MNRAERRRHRRHHHHHGPRRRSAITWTTFTMPEAITILDRLHALHALDGQDTPELRALLLEHGGYLVIAHADAVDPT